MSKTRLRDALKSGRKTKQARKYCFSAAKKRHKKARRQRRRNRR